MTFFAVAVFILGTIIGSFLNVVALRYNTGFSLGGRSRCFSCGKTLNWYELIPVFSYLFLRGKCSACKSKISIQYPLVEATTGLLFVGIFFHVSHLLFIDTTQFVVMFAFYAIIFSILVVITIYDIFHTIIPDGLVYTFIALAGLLRIFLLITSDFSKTELLNTAAGIIFFTFFFLLWFISRGTWMGFGDAKLVFGIGLLLGLVSGLSALFLAFWIGSAIGLVLLWLATLGKGTTSLFHTQKQITMKTEIPFAPYLILGTALVFFFGINVFHFFAF
jgi:prepilin signal peptidase PulO-like enzyme (type II secretory pathway)